MICLATPRVLLRTWRAEDRTDLDELLGDHEQSIGNLDARRVETNAKTDRVEAFEQAWTNDGHGIFALEALDGGRLLGLAGLLDDVPTGRTLELVWRVHCGPTATESAIAEAADVATEALMAVTDWAFGLLDIDAISAWVGVDDNLGGTVAEGAGLSLASRTIDPLTNAWVNHFTITLASWNEEGA